MISLRILSSLRNIPLYLKQSSLQVHTSATLLNSKDSSSSSSSSESSDSDSDKEDQRLKEFSKKPSTEGLKDAEETLKTSNVNERLHNLLLKINEASQKKQSSVSHEKTQLDIELPNVNDAKVKPKLNKSKKSKPISKKVINVAIKPKKVRFTEMSKEEKLKQKPHEHQIKQAAKDVAQSLGGDTQKTELELLTQALNVQPQSLDTAPLSTEEKPADLGKLLSKMKVNIESPNQKLQRPSHYLETKSKDRKPPSIALSVLYAKSKNKPKGSRYRNQERDELNVSFQPMGILKKIPTNESKDTLELSTWNAMEAREMRLSILTVPQNVFQELIQWTNEGKIWHFPIDNEQGMEDELNVHFSEHVFMERHLKGWCPRRGPIRHFMELVCTGLSKNPYMTVEEKVGHITWYRNYFEDKKELLHELGVLDDKAPPVSSSDKKQIEA